jgi:hypothetical protein
MSTYGMCAECYIPMDSCDLAVCAFLLPLCPMRVGLAFYKNMLFWKDHVPALPPDAHDLVGAASFVEDCV